jgi:DNA-binding NarL/FixJ family response regulator
MISRAVKLHLHHIFRKLAVSNRLELGLLGRDRGWI